MSLRICRFFLLVVSTTLWASVFAETTFSVNGLQTDVAIEASYDVIVVGAGDSGLSAGLFLTDYDFIILERSDRVGGNTIGGTYEGITYGLGSELLLPKMEEFDQAIERLNLSLKEIPSPRDAFFRNGRFYYGMEGLALAVIEESGLDEYNRFLTTIPKAFVELSIVPDLDLISAQEWFELENFPPLFRDLYQAKARSMFGAGLQEISAKGLLAYLFLDVINMPPVTDPTLLKNDPDQATDLTPRTTFMTGSTEYIQALAEALHDHIQLNSSVVSVTQSGNRMIVTYTDLEGNSHALQAKAVIMAVPANIVGYLAPEVLSEEQKTILSQITYSSFGYVTLFSQEPIFNQALDLRITEEVSFTHLIDNTWTQRYYDETVKNQGVYINTVQIAPTSYLDQSIKTWTDEQIIEMVYSDLEKIDPDVRSKIKGYEINRFSNGAPVLTIGSMNRLQRLHNISTGPLFLAGSYIYLSDFQFTAKSGYDAAENAKEWLDRQSAVDHFEGYSSPSHN